MESLFDISRVDAGIRGTLFHGKLHHFSTIDSTNTRALVDAQAGAAAGQVYIADEQTAGRGRGGHTWHSEPDRGLYLTAMVRPPLPADAALSISLAAGLAASYAIEQTIGYRIDLRWPNDLVTVAEDGSRSRKFGGILTEGASTTGGELRHAAIGIGINLNQVEFPPELAGQATSLRVECGHTVSREAIAIALLNHLDRELTSLSQMTGEDVLTRFATRSSWVHGKHVQVAEDGGYTGVTTGLTAQGLLRVQCDDGLERVVRHGGVREL